MDAGDGSSSRNGVAASRERIPKMCWCRGGAAAVNKSCPDEALAGFVGFHSNARSSLRLRVPGYRLALMQMRWE